MSNFSNKHISKMPMVILLSIFNAVAIAQKLPDFDAILNRASMSEAVLVCKICSFF